MFRSRAHVFIILFSLYLHDGGYSLLWNPRKTSSFFLRRCSLCKTWLNWHHSERWVLRLLRLLSRTIMYLTLSNDEHGKFLPTQSHAVSSALQYAISPLNLWLCDSSIEGGEWAFFAARRGRMFTVSPFSDLGARVNQCQEFDWVTGINRGGHSSRNR